MRPTLLTRRLLERGGAQFDDAAAATAPSTASHVLGLEPPVATKRRLTDSWPGLPSEYLVCELDRLLEGALAGRPQIETGAHAELWVLRALASAKAVCPDPGDSLECYRECREHGAFQAQLVLNNLGVLHARRQACSEALTALRGAVRAALATDQPLRAPIYNAALILDHLRAQGFAGRRAYLDALNEITQLLAFASGAPERRQVLDFALGEDGLLGGFTVAFLSALVNVAGSFYAGWAMRGLTLPGARRVIGVAAAATWLVGLLVFQLAVGHYRALLAQMPPERVMAAAIAQLTTNPLLIPDLSAWLLVLVGLTFAVVAAIAGFALREPIPGWRDAARRLQAAEHAYAALKESFLGMIQQAQDEQIAAIDTLVAEARDATMQSVIEVAEIRRCVEAHAATVSSVADAYAMDIRRFRQVFERVAGRPGPWRCGAEPLLPIPGLVAGSPVPTVEEVAVDRERRLELLADAADEVRRALRRASIAAMTALPSLIAEIEGSRDGRSTSIRSELDPEQLTLWPATVHGGPNACAS